MTHLEEITFNSLERVVTLYKAAKNDENKLYQLNNAISILSALKAFLDGKTEIITQASTVTVNASYNEKVEINVLTAPPLPAPESIVLPLTLPTTEK